MKSRVERDYSGRSLFEKLGIFAEAHVAIVGPHDEGFVTGLNEGLAKAASQSLRTSYDLIFVRIDAPADLRRIRRAAEHLHSNGSLWIFHPKGRAASPSEAEVRAAGIAVGLVDNKISGYTETHTATRFVIPLARR
ncbi:MAG TPA: hypothetical protein VGI19_17840 [Candidatus Cybelea sp.]|jgi:ABC-type sugar transport system substrate-binding protein